MALDFRKVLRLCIIGSRALTDKAQEAQPGSKALDDFS